MQRKLTAILSADVVGFSGLMEADEAGTLERLKVNRNRIFDPNIAIHGGRLIKLMGDGALVEFPSAVAAVDCAMSIQQATENFDTDLGPARRIRYRIGINLGEVIVEGDDIYGDGVNLAARLQALAPTGGITLSRVVRDLVEGKTSCTFEDLGQHVVKNIERPVQVFSVRSGASAQSTVAGKAPEPLLAVLAFDNLSGDPEMAYFSDGISEEILQTVAHGSNIKVIARSSSFQFRGANKAIRHVASELKSTHVLDGSVRRSGSHVRISANLIECSSQTTLWSDRFDRQLSDVFALQDEIATAVAAGMKTMFAPAPQREAIDPKAYNLYLKALEIRSKGLDAPTRASVIMLLEQATELAPNFARAWSFLATTRAARFRTDETEESDSALRSKVISAADQALKLDPGLGGAYQALGQLEAFGRYAEREALHKKALSVAPNDLTVLTNVSFFYAEIGMILEALKHSRHAYDMDPMFPWSANWHTALLDFAGPSDESRARWENLCQRWPDNDMIAWHAIYTAAALKDWDWFDRLVETARAHKLTSPRLLHIVDSGLRQRDPSPANQARTLSMLRQRLSRTGFVPLENYPTLYRMGLANEAFELIDEISFAFMFDPHLRTPIGSASDGGIFSLSLNEAMMRDIRFVRLCSKLGLCDYWAKTDRWPDCAAKVASDYDFKAEARRLAAV